MSSRASDDRIYASAFILADLTREWTNERDGTDGSSVGEWEHVHFSSRYISAYGNKLERLRRKNTVADCSTDQLRKLFSWKSLHLTNFKM